MKVTRESTQQFRPINIILESVNEVLMLSGAVRNDYRSRNSRYSSGKDKISTDYIAEYLLDKLLEMGY